MRDQAEALRIKLLEQQGQLGKAVAIVSGKGGVGKSNFCMNFALQLAQQQKKVVIIDMDIGMGNIHILIGESASYNLGDYLKGERSLEEVVFSAPYGMDYIAGGSGMSSVLEWTDSMFERLILAFDELLKRYDYLLFDMGAGATTWSLDLLMSIDDIIVITTAEPTAITDAYSMMKYIHLKDDAKQYYLICNRVLAKQEGEETTSRLKLAMQRFLEKDIRVLGTMPEDLVVRQAVREQVPFSVSSPNAAVTKALRLIVLRFLEEPQIEVAQQPTTFLRKLRNIFSKGRD
ncbi:Flagellum site-determining protein YlxH [Metalysinibacillus saudimassiliensis]|uniref:Flagellum site-determining protein YlxH n=1 Tax=Metalysinibacillus saudimassiliensis TaxID=1461583 RepID=A0A078ME45_9BACL|nr:Flagellum site-determining protein YlxH [Metalysinibacillus saudimassiliensis]